MHFTHKKDLPAQAGKGFTLIELIISIFILSVAIVAIFNVFSIITILTSDTSDRLTATYLVQEGMEIARNIRDTNWLRMDACPGGATPCASWVDGLGGLGFGCSSGCEAAYTSTAMSAYAAGSYLYSDAKGFYTYGSGTKTKFERKIIITPVTDTDGNSSNPHIAKVETQVSWDKKATIIHSGHSADDGFLNCATADNCISAEETLYDWYNAPSSAKDFTSFYFGINGEKDNPIDFVNHEITIIVPSGTDVRALVANFSITGTSATVDNALQTSGDTSNPDNQHNFAGPIIYTVHAQDGSTQDYTVDVSGE